jgi:hypothetical protein
VGFKHLRYEVAESNGTVTITIEKKMQDDYSFWVRTVDGTAKAGEDYVEKCELITMHPSEKEREIQIAIQEDLVWEPDEEFKVQLCEEVSQNRLPGNDTECVILIQDNDKPGSIGFSENYVDVKRKDQMATIMLVRTNGSDGELKCKLNTINNADDVPGK